jgi:hypothetical protein
MSIKESAVSKLSDDLISFLKILSLAKVLEIQIENGEISLLILSTIVLKLEDLVMNLKGVSLTLSA